jgi:hypothetical protein
VTRSSHHDEEEFISGNSQMSNDANESDYENEATDQDQDNDLDENRDKIECPKCTLFNPKHLKICEVCGATLHLAPIKIQNSRRPQSSASKSSGTSRNRHQEN